MQNTERDKHTCGDILHVAVAVIVNSAQQVLIAKRPDHVHQGGFWEFPGGKVEPGEAVYDALCREIHEELHIQISCAQPLIRITHHYSDKSVLLDVWMVTEFHGIAHGAEGQPLMWQSIHDLKPNMFPPANRKIISALQLPDKLLITGEFSDPQDFIARLTRSLQAGIKLVQLRCKATCDTPTYHAVVKKSKSLCDASNAKILLNSDPDLAENLQLGLHLNSHDLFEYQIRPVAYDRLFSASCHDLRELKQAEKLQADFVLLSPVKQTASHPDEPAMGWKEFALLVASTNIPVFALGGMLLSDINDARCVGAQGIAAISALWCDK